MEIKRAGKHTDAPNYQVHEIWWICFESARHRHTEVFVQRLPLNPRAKLIPQPKYATAPRMAAGEGVGEGRGGMSSITQRQAGLRATTWGGAKTDEAEWKRAACDTALLSPPCTTQDAPDYIISAASQEISSDVSEPPKQHYE